MYATRLWNEKDFFFRCRYYGQWMDYIVIWAWKVLLFPSNILPEKSQRMKYSFIHVYNVCFDLNCICILCLHLSLYFTIISATLDLNYINSYFCIHFSILKILSLATCLCLACWLESDALLLGCIQRTKGSLTQQTHQFEVFYEAIDRAIA